MGGIEFKPAKFLEHLVVIILDCGDKLFSSSYRDTHALMGKQAISLPVQVCRRQREPPWSSFLDDLSFPGEEA